MLYTHVEVIHHGAEPDDHRDQHRLPPGRDRGGNGAGDMLLSIYAAFGRAGWRASHLGRVAE